MLADLVSHGPLMPLLGRLASKVNELTFSSTLCPTPLWLLFVQAHNHSQMALSKIDRINGRLGNAGRIQQLVHETIDRLNHLVSRQIVEHGALPHVYVGILSESRR